MIENFDVSVLGECSCLAHLNVMRRTCPAPIEEHAAQRADEILH
jgi:hypothetical protein